MAHGAGHAVMGLLEEDGPSGVVTLAKRDQNFHIAIYFIFIITYLTV